MPEFIHGLDLNRLYFQQVVKPLIDQHFPGLKYSAGLLGEGSDVLHFDSPQSMDHNWGPHVRIFLTEQDFRQKRDEIHEMLRHKLPYEFMGYPTNFTKPNEKKYLVTQMKAISRGPVNHMIEFYTIKSFFEHYLGFDPYQRITYRDWLTFPQQALLEVTKGEVYFDGLGELNKIREKFQYYPDDVWMYIYMIQWERLGNVEMFMGRSGQVGDELGSRVLAAEIVHNIMDLCFTMEKQYIPYRKWFGLAFSRLKCAPNLTHLLLEALHQPGWEKRQEILADVYRIIADMHNELRLTRQIKIEADDFHGRPFKVIHALKVRDEIEKNLQPFFANLKYKLGALDQWISHTIINRINYVYKEFKDDIK
jgi:hypothetical protein